MVSKIPVAGNRPLPTVLVLAILVGVTPAAALEVRQPDGGARYHVELTRAYAPCLAPNTITFAGYPACVPAVTSVCKFYGGTVDIESDDDVTPQIRVQFSRSVQSACNGDYFADVTVRASGEYSTDDSPEGGLEAPCASGRCTAEDVVVRVRIGASAVNLPTLPGIDLRDGNVEIRGITIVAPDGLPLAAAGIGHTFVGIGSKPADELVANLSVPYPECPAGSGYCDVPPWSSPCDFETGELAWTRAGSESGVHVTLKDLTGSSPLCTTGTYMLEATFRSTVEACGDVQDPTTCTAVDRTMLVPLAADGRDLDATGIIPVGTSGMFANGIEILSTRILDPSGEAVAAIGLPSVTSAPGLQIAAKGDVLRVRALIPIEFDTTIDPTLEEGLTFTLSDRDTEVYGVNIPAVRWQLQPPLGSRWDYVDPDGVLNGVRKIRVKRVAKKGLVIGYKLDLTARGVVLPAVPEVTMTLDVRRVVQGIDDLLRVQNNRTCRASSGKLVCK